MDVVRTGPTVTTVTMDASGPGWEQWFLLRSDAHHDNLHCDQALEKEHLKEAVAKRAGIIDCGDLFCAMQGKWDKRADPDQMRPELYGKDYLDRLAKYNADFYAPYAKNFVQISPGNHETSILHHHQVDLTAGLAGRLSAAAGHGVIAGTYSGWVRFQFTRGRKSMRKMLRYTHGYGGGGPVTRDVIQSARQAVYIEGADIFASGHTHDAWDMPIMRERIDHLGRARLEEMIFLKLGGYKDEYSPGEGWAVGKGMPPKPKGAYWVKFSHDRRVTNGRSEEGIRIDTMRAK